ncbi:MAG: DUF512 domain-containing protein [Clostridia bacterium]|nr:DUF512 domain-containing protein [Clostridia bacterium]
MPPEPLRIESIAARSPAARTGLRPGDRIVAMQGEPAEDVIDYMFFAGDPDPEIEVERDGIRLRFTVPSGGGQDLGIRLEPGQLRPAVCRNRCLFCFVDQMPRGFRPALYVKDDDWRFSFLYGSYVTLTNMREHDYERIRRRCISPLYISVHATDDDVRSRLLGTSRGRGVMPSLRRLAAGGTAFHAQCVIVGGINDGAVLERTVRDLASLHPHALSVALVPVGLTSCRSGLPEVRPLRPEEAEAVVRLCGQLQAEFLEKLGTRFVFAADELYLQAGLALPPPESYEDFCQLENGVGLAADFREAAEAAMAAGGRPRAESFLLVTGLGIAPQARDLAAELRRRLGVDIETAAVANSTFGPLVNVTGLLTGADVAAALAGHGGSRTVLLPDVMFRDGSGVTLDNMTPEEIGRRIGAPCAAVPAEGGAFVRALLEPEEKR